MLTQEEINSLTNRTRPLYENIYKEESRYFIEKGTDATFFQWLGSKGTSIDCYIRFINETNTSDGKLLNDKIERARIIFYALLKPFQSSFFYWTLLLLILYRFNTKKPIMKLILYHYLLRAIGDIIDQLGNLLPYYFSLDLDGNCVSSYAYTEQHPLRWFLTRQINSFFWYIGEIIGDWYPLIRTRAVTKNKNSLKLLYITCIFYNLSKLSVPISQLYLSPAKLYNKDNGTYEEQYVNGYYNVYWALQAVIVFATFIYEIVIYTTLKKELFNKTIADYGFLKKFRLISEFRIIISAVVAIISFPFLFIVSILKIYCYYTGRNEVNCSVEEFRGVVTNVQYMIIFIDQILLLNTKYDGKSKIDKSTFSTDRSSGDFNTGILHSQDANVKKIVFNSSISNKKDYDDNKYNSSFAYNNNNNNNNNKYNNASNTTFNNDNNSKFSTSFNDNNSKFSTSFNDSNSKFNNSSATYNNDDIYLMNDNYFNNRGRNMNNINRMNNNIYTLDEIIEESDNNIDDMYPINNNYYNTHEGSMNTINRANNNRYTINGNFETFDISMNTLNDDRMMTTHPSLPRHNNKFSNNLKFNDISNN